MANETTRPLKVFLCHASGDKPAVRDLYKRLIAEGVDAWLDQEKLLPGQDWRVEIPRAVREADVVVICLSNKSITKEGYIQKEIRFALDSAEEKPEGTIFLIPARLEDCVVPERLSGWQWVDLFEENGLVRLLRSLKLRAAQLGATIESTSYVDSDKERERRLEQLYTEGLAAFYTEDWDKACRRFQSILSEQPNNKNAAEKLTEAERQRNLAKLYEQATQAIRSEEWQSAITTLEELSQKSASYKDVAQLLGNARKQEQLRELYSEAKTLYAAQKWQAVVKVFEQISVIEPNYPDPEGLFTSAQKEVVELKRIEELNVLYSQAVREMDSGNWYEARSLLEQVHKAQTGFLDTERLLRKVENEIITIEELKKRDNKINTLYEQAHGLIRSKSWRMALDKMGEIQRLDDQFVDKDGIFEKAKTELNHEEQIAQRQNELSAMYAEAVRLLKDGKYQEALGKWQEVRSVDPKYPDRQGVQRIARRQLNELAKPSQIKPRLIIANPIWTRIIGFIAIGIVIAGVIGMFIFMSQPPTLPQCAYISSMNDPLFMKSNLNSSFILVDGKITYPSEWANSRCYKVGLAAQPSGGVGCGSGASSIPSEWFLMNDNQRFYLLVRFSKNDFTPAGILFSYFYPYPYTGRWQFSDSMAFFGSKTFDQYGWDETKWYDDTTDGGIMNTRAKSSQDNQSYWFEFSKLLDSGDGHDWIWKPGDKVGTGLTGDLMMGSFGTSSVSGESFSCRLIQLQLGK